MKHILALIAFLVCVSPVMAETTGWAVETYTDGTAGLAYYQSNWAAGLTGKYTRSDNAGVMSRELVVAPWAAYRHLLNETTHLTTGVSYGIGISGVEEGSDKSNDSTVAIFSGLDYELSSKFLLQGFVSYGVHSYSDSASAAYTTASFGSTLGLTYFF